MELSSIVFILRTLALFLLPLAFLLFKFKKDPRIFEHLSKMTGPDAYPIIGSAYDLIGLTSIEIFERISYTNIKKYGRLFRVWVLNIPQLAIGSAKYAEKILQGMTHHAKSQNYKILDSWMGKGLLTANDGMWKTHRKILTPAFHFNILHEFLPIFNKCSKELVEKLDGPAQKEQVIDIFEYVTLCALDIICESSMGASINAQQQKDSSYVKAIRELNDLLVKRYFTPYLRIDFIYNLSWHKWKTERAVKIANDFTDKIIEDRRKYLKQVKGPLKSEHIDEFTEKRRPLAFIDLLLAAQDEGEQHMTNKDIRDQVSTFMFEGHDTVTTATCWALFIMGTYPEIQEKAVEELRHVFGNSGRAPTMNDLNELKYLERCLKETLRLYPSVPFFERHLREDQPFEGGIVAPGGVTASFNVYVIHRDPEHFPDPEKFDPDRFLPENSKGRHPYAYLPFSAGPRNCIGQKFAMMEEKIVVSTVLRHFVVEAAHALEEAQIKVGLVLKPENGLKIKLRRRSGADSDLAIV